jgi:aspartyl-tRNA(Asn)/glutamyl-tRNA(Gln) amidotransferase subunit C
MDQPTIDVAHVARLARLRLDEAALARCARHLQAILHHFETLAELDTAEVEPAVYAVDVAGCVREDRERTDRPARDALLANAPALADGFFVVPRVIE